MYCWNCAHIVNDGEKRCPSCGTSTKFKKGIEIKYCSNCGKSVWGKKKCKYCSFDVILGKYAALEDKTNDSQKTYDVILQKYIVLGDKISDSQKTDSTMIVSDGLRTDKEVSSQKNKSNRKKVIISLFSIVAILGGGIGSSVVLLNHQENSSSSNETMQLFDSDNKNDENSEIKETETEEVVVTDVVEVITTIKMTTTKATTTTVSKNHRYELIQSAIGWEEANTRAIALGGRLAEVHSEDDWYKLLAAIDNTEVYYIWLGAKRSSDFSSMYWNSGEEVSPYWSHWYTNEPSYVDANDSSIIESYLMLWWLKDSGWSLNDANASATLNAYKDYRIGYVVEYDY